jgi:hypothetical protein
MGFWLSAIVSSFVCVSGLKRCIYLVHEKAFQFYSSLHPRGSISNRIKNTHTHTHTYTHTHTLTVVYLPVYLFTLSFCRHRRGFSFHSTAHQFALNPVTIEPGRISSFFRALQNRLASFHNDSIPCITRWFEGCVGGA